jgi:hypothetical protein
LHPVPERYGPPCSLLPQDRVSGGFRRSGL